jgi:hypothetical protein
MFMARRLKTAEIATIRTLHETEYSIPKIAQLVGIPRETVGPRCRGRRFKPGQTRSPGLVEEEVNNRLKDRPHHARIRIPIPKRPVSIRSRLAGYPSINDAAR